MRIISMKAVSKKKKKKKLSVTRNAGFKETQFCSFKFTLSFLIHNSQNYII